MIKIKLIFLLAFSLTIFLNAQTDSIEVYLIDAYVKPELPHTFTLSFYTSEFSKSKVIINDEYEFEVSEEFIDNHKASIVLTDLNFKSKIVPFIIEMEDEEGNIFKSEVFDFDLPYEPEIKSGSDFFTICLFAGTIFLLPYPSYVGYGSESFFSLTKEIPLISFRSKSFNYPAGFISIEYSYIFDFNHPGYLRAGYKKIYEIPGIEYISPGVTLYTNFFGNNGVAPELSVGLFTIAETFTLYARYRYNIRLSDALFNFHEISLGLYSGFFSFYLD